MMFKISPSTNEPGCVLYSYLYVLLTNEDAALLVGSIGLFVILGGIMFVTRGIDWTAKVSHSDVKA